ncbi:MAG TPA: tryptophan synthase subunit alpha [Methanomassiliicoccales archaeon]|nr:tryptophan synthase subunit alpha [Methanomassiliicoccales archaeon]
MSVIRSAIERERRGGKGALICYLTAGYPSPGSFKGYFDAYADGGADIIEIGVPFSDPVADGPTIQATTQRAIEMGVTPIKVLDLVKEARKGRDVPVVLMGYYNPIFRMGEEEFVRRAVEARVDGLIVADLPCEESSGLRRACCRSSLDLIQLIAPTTSDARMRRICSASSGYVYLVGALGTTGSRPSLERELPDLVRRAKAASGRTPLAVGFGVSRKEHVRQIVALGADGVIVGSAILSRMMEGAGEDDVRDFIAELKEGCGRAPS